MVRTVFFLNNELLIQDVILLLDDIRRDLVVITKVPLFKKNRNATAPVPDELKVANLIAGETSQKSYIRIRSQLLKDPKFSIVKNPIVLPTL